MQKQNKIFNTFLLVGITFSIFTLLSFTSCNTTDPPTTTKSPRDYTWTVDTLGLPNTFQTLMRSIWGSSENDVYTCGHYSGNEVGFGDLWHFDGENWKAVDYSEKIGVQGSLQAVRGTSEDNIWVVGYKSSFSKKLPYIIQYDGIRWKRYEVDSESGVYGVHVVDRFETWACGEDGIVYHYKDRTWELDTIKVPMGKEDVFIIYSVLPYNSEIYAVGTNREKNSADTQYYFFKKENGIWKVLDKIEVVVTSTIDDITFGGRLIVANNNQLLSYGSYGIYIWTNNSWEKYFATNYGVASVFSQTKNNFFAVGDFGIKYHYDGNNWQELNKIEIADIVYTGVWANRSETFIVGFKGIGTAQKTLVLHGK